MNAAGKVVSVTVAEPRFRPDDVELLLASRRVEREPRGPHGHLMSEATDKATWGKWHVPPPTVDFAQAALNREQQAYAKQWPEADMDSLLWSVERRD